MKKHLPIIALCVATLLFISNSSNPPNGRTGAPGDFGTCMGCHTGSNPNIDGDVTISGLPAVVEASQTYTLTVTSNNPSMVALKAGFQMVGIDDNENNAGTLSNPSNLSTLTNANQRVYLEHNPAKNMVGGSVSWNVDWTAPAPGTLNSGESIHFYAASVLANGNGSNSSDKVVTTIVSAEYNAPAVLEVNIIDANNLICFNGNDGSATAEASNGTPPYNYNWSSGDNGDTAENLSPGNYTVTATDNDGNTATTSVLIEQMNPIVITANVIDNSCFGESEGMISYSLQNAGNPVDVIVIDENSGNVVFEGVDVFLIDNFINGNYTLIINDNMDCTAEFPFTISSPDELEISNSIIEDVSCTNGNDGSILLIVTGGTPNYSFAWSNGQTVPNPMNLVAGNYTVTIIDGMGCGLIEDFVIEEPDNPLNVDFSVSGNIFCFGEEVIFISATPTGGTAPYDYEWSNGQTTPIIANIGAGEFSITITDSNGCGIAASIIITGPDELIVELDVTQMSAPGANDGSIEAIASGGVPPYTYFWSNGEATPLIENLEEGEYTLTITDSNNCSAVASALIDNNLCTLEATVVTTDAVCFDENNGTVELNIENETGNVSIAWSTGDMDVMSLSNLYAGDYAVTISDEKPCLDTVYFTIGQPDSLYIETISIMNPGCGSEEGLIETKAVGGILDYSYEWNTGDLTPSIMPTTAGDYSLTVADMNGCTAMEEYILSDIDTLGPTGIFDTIIRYYIDDIIVVEQEDVEDAVVSLSDNCSSDIGISFEDVILDCTNLGFTTHDVTLNDNNGNTSTASVVIELLDTIPPTFICPEDHIVQVCDTNNLVIIDYDFMFVDNCQVVETITEGFTEGFTIIVNEIKDYPLSVTLIDESGNTTSCSWTVSGEGFILDFDVEVTDALCFDSNDGSLSFTLNNYDGDFVAFYDETQTNFDSIPVGEHHLSIVDSTGCEATFNFTIGPPEAMDFMVTDYTPATGSESNGQLTIDISGGIPGYSYEWTFNGTVVSNTNSLVDVAAGFYILTVTDANGCMQEFGFTIENTDSIAELEDLGIFVYPNPFQDFVTIETTEGNVVSTASLYNILGQNVPFEWVQKSSKSIISTATLKEGTYILKLEIDNRIQLVKLVKS